MAIEKPDCIVNVYRVPFGSTGLFYSTSYASEWEANWAAFNALWDKGWRLAYRVRCKLKPVQWNMPLPGLA